MSAALSMSEKANLGVVADAQTFQWQSWFDNTLLQDAIAVQPSGTLIISPKDSQMAGYSLTNSPDSQVPIAVTAKQAGSGAGGIATFILAPGQSLAPFDKTRFRAFTWGLPIGWLGGGFAEILVSQERELGGYTAQAEIPFHRARFAVKQPTDLTSSTYNNSPLNWPIRFPWVQAVNANAVSQAGSPIIAVQPTRIVMALRGLTTLAAVANMRCIIQGSDDFSLDAGGVQGALTQTNPVFEELQWPVWTSIGTSGNLATQNPALDIDASHPLVRLGCSGVGSSPSAAPTSVGVTFVDDTGAGVLSGCYVDVIRYGVI
jgi:hypothetical protein